MEVRQRWESVRGCRSMLGNFGERAPGRPAQGKAVDIGYTLSHQCIVAIQVAIATRVTGFRLRTALPSPSHSASCARSARPTSRLPDSSARLISRAMPYNHEAMPRYFQCIWATVELSSCIVTVISRTFPRGKLGGPPTALTRIRGSPGVTGDAAARSPPEPGQPAACARV